MSLRKRELVSSVFIRCVAFSAHVIVIPWVCPPVRGDNPRALASGLSYVHVDKHGMV